MVTATFVKNDDLFLHVFHRETRIQYSFLYSIENKQIISSIKTLEVSGNNMLNFSIKSFYNPLCEEVYSFYRQGQCVTVDMDNFEEDIQTQ